MHLFWGFGQKFVLNVEKDNAFSETKTFSLK